MKDINDYRDGIKRIVISEEEIRSAVKKAGAMISEKYKGEPYVFAGDVYSNKDNPGRCGWSWYTGSAAWAYRLITEEFFGLIRKADKLYIKPKLPKKLDGATVTYRYGSGVFLIEYRFGIRERILVDGVKSDYVELREGCNCLVSVEIGF